MNSQRSLPRIPIIGDLTAARVHTYAASSSRHRKDRIVMPMWLDLKRLGKNRQNSRSRRVDHFPAPWCESGSVSGRHWSSA